EVYLVTPEGLRSLKEVAFNGRIAIMQSFRMPNEEKDMLFIMTMKYNVMILEINRDPMGDFEVITRAHGIVAERVGQPAENGSICAINPKARIIALRIYNGLLNLIKFD